MSYPTHPGFGDATPFIQTYLELGLEAAKFQLSEHIASRTEQAKLLQQQRRSELENRIAIDSAKFDESWEQVFAIFMFPQHQLEFDAGMQTHYAAYYAALAKYEKSLHYARKSLAYDFTLEDDDFKLHHKWFNDRLNEFVAYHQSNKVCSSCVNHIKNGATIRIHSERSCMRCDCNDSESANKSTVVTSCCFICTGVTCDLHGDIDNQIELVYTYMSALEKQEQDRINEEIRIGREALSLNNKPPSDKERRQVKFNKKQRYRKKLAERKLRSAKQDTPAHSRKRYSQKKGAKLMSNK